MHVVPYNPCLRSRPSSAAISEKHFGTMCKSLRSNYVEGGEGGEEDRNRGPGSVTDLTWLEQVDHRYQAVI